MIGRVYREAGWLRWAPAGRLDGEAVAGLRAALTLLCGEAGPGLDVDLAGVTYLDEAGVAALGFVFRRVRGAGGALRVSGAREQPLAVLRGFGLAEAWGLEVAEAVAPRAVPGWAGWAAGLGRRTV